MANGRTLQRNAADPKQVGYAGRKEKQHAERFADSLRAVMGTPAGRFVLWTLLERAGIYESVMPVGDEVGSHIYYKAGKQDYGHRLVGSIIDADEDAYQLMEREMRAWLKSEQREAAAVQQQSADTGE